MHTISFAVIDHDPIGIELGHGIRRARIEGCRFLLGNLLGQSIKLGRRRLKETRFLLHAQYSNSLEHTQGANAIDICCIFRCLKTDLHMALCGKVINFVRLAFLHDTDQIC